MGLVVAQPETAHTPMTAQNDIRTHPHKMIASLSIQTDPATWRSAVYVAAMNAVNRRAATIRSWCPALAILSRILLVTVSAAAPGCRCVRLEHSPRTIIAVRYDGRVNTANSNDGPELAALTEEMGRLARLGFDTVVLPVARIHHRDTVDRAADHSGLRTIIAGSGGAGPARLVGRSEIRSLRRLAPVVIVADDGNVAHSPLERMLIQYHAGVCNGKTDGVVVQIRGERFDDASNRGYLLQEQRAGLRTLIDRVRRWGPHLHGADVGEVETIELKPPFLRAVLLTNGVGRHLLLFNRSRTRYARGWVRVSGLVGSRPVVRAVEVPALANRLNSGVYHARRERLTLPIRLRPGDAALFELF